MEHYFDSCILRGIWNVGNIIFFLHMDATLKIELKKFFFENHSHDIYLAYYPCIHYLCIYYLLSLLFIYIILYIWIILCFIIFYLSHWFILRYWCEVNFHVWYIFFSKVLIIVLLFLSKYTLCDNFFIHFSQFYILVSFFIFDLCVC